MYYFTSADFFLKIDIQYYVMNISDSIHQKDSFYECINQTYDKRNKIV